MRILLKAADETTGFAHEVCLQRKLLIYGRQGLTVRVLVEDEWIEKEGLYALVVHPLLKDRSDLQVKPVLLKAEVAGRLEVVTDIQNPCPQKYKLRRTEIGMLVHVDELNEDQIDEHFGNYADLELKPDLSGTQSCGKSWHTKLLLQGHRFFATDVRKLIYTDLKQREQII